MIERLAAFYEGLTPQRLERELETLYAPHAQFKDPFNEVRGIAPIRRIFEHMYTQVQQPRFVVASRMQLGQEGFLTWEFHFQSSGRPICIRGATHVQFDTDGRVSLHRDYWDAAEELYEKVALLGGLMRFIKRRLRA